MKLVLPLLTALVLPAITSVWAQTPQGIEDVEVVKAKATVQALDVASRKATLLFEDGKKKTVKVDKSVRNLDQVKVGDKVSLTYAEDIVVLVGKTKETAGAAGAGMVAIAPKGSQPGGMMVDTVSLTAKVVSVDTQKHRVVLQEPDGKNKTVKLGKKVTNLDQLKPGETIDMVVTEELIVDVTH